MKKRVLPTVNDNSHSSQGTSSVTPPRFPRMRSTSKPTLILMLTTFVLTFCFLGHMLSDIKKNKEIAEIKVTLNELWAMNSGKEFCSGLEKSKDGSVAKIDGIKGVEPFHIEVYPENDIVSESILKHGSWDPSKLELFQKIVGDYSSKTGIPLKELTFVDIGSNIGWFTLSMAAAGLDVMAFEPMPSNVGMIKRSVCMGPNIASGVSKRIQLFPYGLGPEEQSCFVISGNINEGDGLILCGEKESDINVPEDYSVRGKIVTKRLDDLASTKGKKIALVKIDVEGFESHVVEGGRDFLLNSKIPFIISEFVPDWIKGRDGGDPERMMNRFYDAGYKVQKKGGHLERKEALVMDQYSLENDVIFELVEEKEKKE